MKIHLEVYNSNWKNDFEEIKSEIGQILIKFRPDIAHIGSTSIIGMKAKPIIDILVGINLENLDDIIIPMVDNHYIYYEKYNQIMPYRRYFVKLKSNSFPSTTISNHSMSPIEQSDKLAHIHILERNSMHWNRHISFRDYLINNKEAFLEYMKLKDILAEKEWKDGNEYNAAKEKFILSIEVKALSIYK